MWARRVRGRPAGWLAQPTPRRWLSITRGGEGEPRFSDGATFDVQILGSSAKSPTSASSCPAVGVRIRGHQWLFDCGEGTQRQILNSSMMKSSALEGICITHMHGDHVLGLPGLLLNAMSRDPDDPLPSVYGPEGLYNYINVVFKLCEARVGHHQQAITGFAIHELVDKVDDDARQMHHRPVPDFQVANIEYKAIPRDPDGYWTVTSNKDFVIRAGRIEHTIPTFGYVVMEATQRGNIDAAKTTALGLPPGPVYKELAEGRDVVLPDGRVIKSAEVMTPPIPGRKLTVLGDTNDPYALAPLAQDSDVLIHEATLESSMERIAVPRGHSTPAMAAKFAKHINAGHLVLNHFSNRYSTMPKAPPVWSKYRQRDEVQEVSEQQSRLVREAEEVLGVGQVTPARDFLFLHLPRKQPNTIRQQLQQQPPRQEQRRHQSPPRVMCSTAPRYPFRQGQQGFSGNRRGGTGKAPPPPLSSSSSPPPPSQPPSDRSATSSRTNHAAVGAL